MNLDIAWCYLQLGNLTELPNAQKRLENCEINLKKSYGANLERVKSLKGTSNIEGVLYFRLHLLQGICAYLSGHTHQAENLVKKADKEFKALHVSNEALEEVMAQGYNEKEARIALRYLYNFKLLTLRIS